jgi:hypothetical protein
MLGGPKGTRDLCPNRDSDREVERSFERALPLARLRKWTKNQEDMIEKARLVASKALAADDLAKSLEALHLAMRAQAELIALVAPKRTVKSKSPTESESQPDANDDAPIMPVPDLSQMSDDEVMKLAGVNPTSNEEMASSTSRVVGAERKPPPRRGRPKGHPVSGAAKLAKERAQERREREQREREQREREARWHPSRSHDCAIAWPAPTIPEEWENDD